MKRLQRALRLLVPWLAVGALAGLVLLAVAAQIDASEATGLGRLILGVFTSTVLILGLAIPAVAAVATARVILRNRVRRSERLRYEHVHEV